MVDKKHIGGDFDDFLHDEGMLDDAEAVATKRVIAFQIAQEMERTHIAHAALERAVGVPLVGDSRYSCVGSWPTPIGHGGHMRLDAHGIDTTGKPVDHIRLDLIGRAAGSSGLWWVAREFGDGTTKPEGIFADLIAARSLAEELATALSVDVVVTDFEAG